MRARQIGLVVLSLCGILALPLVALMLGLNVMGPGGAEQSRSLAVAGVVVSAAVAIWAAVEVIVASRRGTSRWAGICAVALSALTAVGYVLLRLGLH